MVSFGQAFKNFWKNYFNFTGMATRAEYWWMVLLAVIAIFGWLIGTLVLALATSSFPAELTGNYWHWFTSFSIIFIIWLVLSVLIFLAVLIPFLSLTMRRYRDTGLNTICVVLLFVAGLISGWSSTDSLVENIFDLITLVVTILPTNKLVKVRIIGRGSK